MKIYSKCEIEKDKSNAKTVPELCKLCHYKNLQPLWAIDNLRKGSKINYSINTKKPKK